MIEFILEIPLTKKITGLSELFVKKPVVELHSDNEFYEFIAWGDPVVINGFRERFHQDKSIEFIINNLYGHYYYLLLNKVSGSISMGNSLFSLLPVYYSVSTDKIFFSENALPLGKHLAKSKINKRFILETLLFNYPLFNGSIFEEINLLPSNSYFTIEKGKSHIRKHTRIENLFGKNPVPWKKSVNQMTGTFLDAVKKYLPEKKYATALTGGFDGRTLTASGLYFGRDISAYSFGSRSSWDTEIAGLLSEKAGIPYIKIELNDDYVKTASLDCGREFILNSSGTATFARAHYLHAAKLLSEQFEHIITGNFGSEVFRALHVTGTVMSKHSISMFDSESPDDFFKVIESGDENKILIESAFKNEWNNLKEGILNLPCFNQAYSGLTKNQRFYVFVFEEMFRKYFGAEMINQFRYIKNRTPFLDIEFLKEIFKTELAGIHSDFFEHSPFKRYKGQVLYAHIIKKAYPDFGKMLTDKGYKPNDLIHPLGKLNIAKGYLKKIMRKTTPDFDPYSVNRAWEYNKNIWQKVPIPGDLFNIKSLEELPKEILFKVLSLSYFVDSLPQRREDAKEIHLAP
ncbi:MAG TPA: hypothetical protein PKL65_00730 [Bacteroidales bacterium]|nr:hypothetical protein [Bacteroidales bacterium]HNR40730.1 hypothetical protein [Bacteroidales bacterium]